MVAGAAQWAAITSIAQKIGMCCGNGDHAQNPATCRPGELFALERTTLTYRMIGSIVRLNGGGRMAMVEAPSPTAERRLAWPIADRSL
jgi:hypothetical protein